MLSDCLPVSLDPVYAFSCYPTSVEIDIWANQLLTQAAKIKYQVHCSDWNPIRQPFGNGPNALVNRYYIFHLDSRRDFCVYWEPSPKQPAPLLVNLPGYGGYISMHPQIADDGYNILHISPMGYVLPRGANTALTLPDGNWPVLPNTALGNPGGYAEWLLDCLIAIDWAIKREDVLSDRISVFGTSQGGGTGLLLTSILQGKIRCVCADLPFLTAFPLTNFQGSAYGLLLEPYKKSNPKEFWKNLGYVDTISHVHRISVPVMLSGGGKDDVCPAETVEYLFQKLHCTKQYTFLQEGVHTHSRESMFLFRNWLSLFA